MANIKPNDFTSTTAPADDNFEFYSQLSDVNLRASVSAVAKGVQGYTKFFVQKSADETRASAVLTADTHLTIPVTQGTYLVDVQIYYTADTAADIKVGFTFPSGTAGTLSQRGLGTGATAIAAAASAAYSAATAIANAVNLGGLTGTKMAGRITGYITVTTNGTLTVQTANLAGTTTTTIHAGSFLLLEKIL